MQYIYILLYCCITLFMFKYIFTLAKQLGFYLSLLDRDPLDISRFVVEFTNFFCLFSFFGSWTCCHQETNSRLSFLMRLKSFPSFSLSFCLSVHSSFSRNTVTLGQVVRVRWANTFLLTWIALLCREGTLRWFWYLVGPKNYNFND